jgi:hypothetical protein
MVRKTFKLVFNLARITNETGKISEIQFSHVCLHPKICHSSATFYISGPYILEKETIFDQLMKQCNFD